MMRCTILAAALAICASAQFRDCQTLDLALGTGVEGTLDANDCFLRDITSSSSASYAKRYRLTITDPAVITLDATASQFDVLLLLYATNPVRLVGFSDDVSETSTDARIMINLPAGSFDVIVSTPDSGTTGSFRLSGAGEVPRACPTLTLPASGVTEGEFRAATSCRFVDLEPYASDEGYAQFYRLMMPRNGVLNVKAETAAEDFGMLATYGTTFDTFAEKDLVASFPAGEVLFFVAAFGEGAYKVTTAVENQRPCATEPYALGGEVSGKLENGGCRLLDYQLPSDDIRPLKLYRMTLDRPTVVRFDQASPVFDTYLYLFDQQSRVLARNDDLDFSGGITDSRITIHLPAGNYNLGASAFDEEELGTYTLQSSGEVPRTCAVPDLVSGQTKEGILPAEGCRLLDFVPYSQNQTFVAPFRLNAQGRKLVSLSLRSNAPGETLSLLGPQSTEVLRIGVNTTTREFEGDITVPNASHTALLWSNAATPPTYSLTATINDPRNCPVNDLGPNDTQQGTLAGAPCRMTDVVQYFPIETPVQTYRINLPGRGRFALSMDPSGFVPHIVAMGGTDTFLGQTPPNAPGTVVTLGGTFNAGELRFHLGTRTTASSFTVRTVFQPESATSAAPSGSFVAPEHGIEPRSVKALLRRAVKAHSASTPLFQ